MSNEKREQQMMDAADRYADEVCDESCTGAQVAETINDFCAGWRAADFHPNWISVKDELPPHRNQTNHKFENDFSVNCFVSDGKDVDTSYYDYRLRKWNCEFLTNVVYWYCPQSPRKEE